MQLWDAKWCWKATVSRTDRSPQLATTTTAEEAIVPVQFTGTGGIHCINPADDPRKSWIAPWARAFPRASPLQPHPPLTPRVTRLCLHAYGRRNKNHRRFGCAHEGLAGGTLCSDAIGDSRRDCDMAQASAAAARR
jgi:hypothetical protein